MYFFAGSTNQAFKYRFCCQPQAAVPSEDFLQPDIRGKDTNR